MTETLPGPDHAPADAVPLPPSTGHAGVDEVLAQTAERLAELPDTALAARREVLDETHRTLRAVLDSPLTAEDA